MEQPNTINRRYEPRKAGVYKFLFFFLLIASGYFVGCKESDGLDQQDPEEQNDGVTVLSESEVTDYDKFYKAAEFSDMDLLRSDSQWSFVRSKQSDHFIVFWDKQFGLDPNAATVPEDMRVDVDDLLANAENFFDVNINTLGFADLDQASSNLDLYKMQIFLLYNTNETANGGGYDDVIGALWVNPTHCQPVGSTIAHEIGHSFQYQTYADLLAFGGISNDHTRGFRYGFGGNGGNAFWEQTAQFQSFLSYPEEAFTSLYFIKYKENCNLHICNEAYRYASYFIDYYWADKYGDNFIGKLWRESESPEDPIEACMRLNDLTVDGMYDELYDAATKFVTWDIDAIRSYGSDYIGAQSYELYALEDGSYQVGYTKCPETTGYNVIPLNVPEAGTVITTSFHGLTPGSALAPADPGLYYNGEDAVTVTNYNSGDASIAGWRYGYVALLESGERVYGDTNQGTSADVAFTVPEGCEKLWFVVMGAPTSYEAHAWDDDMSNDAQWPYTVKFTNTDLLGNIEIDPNSNNGDLTLTYDITMPAGETAVWDAMDMENNGDFARIGEAFGVQPSNISSLMLDPKETPQEGKIAFAAVESDGSLNYDITGYLYTCYFDRNGDVTATDDGIVFAYQFEDTNQQFTITAYFADGAVSGEEYTLKEALVYTKDGEEHQVTVVCNVTVE